MRRLTRREQALCAASLLGVAGWALWSLLILSALDLRTDSLARIQKAHALADLLATADSSGAPARARQPLATVLTDRAETAQLSIRRLEPAGTAIAVTLDDAPYTAVVGWMAGLTEDEGLRIAAVEMGRRPAPGVVAARITLEPGQ